MNPNCRFAFQIGLGVITGLAGLMSPFILSFVFWQATIKDDISTLKAEVSALRTAQADFRREYREDVLELRQALRAR